MSTSYQTSAKPRGRRDTENADTFSRSRATSEASRILSKKISKSSDETTPAKGSRPSSPALFMQRNRLVDQKMSTIEPISPKSSSTSMKAERHYMWNESDEPMVIPSARSAPKTPSSVQTTPSVHPEPQTLRNLTQPNVNSRPATPISRVSEAAEQSRVLGAAPLAEVATKTPSVPSSAPAEPSSTTSSVTALQPRVEDAIDDATPTLTPVKSSPKPMADLVKMNSTSQTENRPESLTPAAVLESSLEHNNEPPASKTISHSSRSATPALSPPHSPRLTHYGGYHGQAPMPYPYFPQHMNSSPMYPGPYYTAPFSPPSEHGLPTNDARSRSGGDDEHNLLLEKVSSVLPDINRLLDQYRETHGQLSAKDLLVKQAESFHADQLNNLRVELDANKTEYEKVIRSVVSENGQLKREVEQLKEKITALQKVAEEQANLKTELEKLQMKHKDLTDNVDSVRLSKEQLLADKLKQDQHIDSMRKQHLTEKEKHHRSLSELKEQLKQQMAAKDEAHAKLLMERDAAHTKAIADREREHSRLLDEKEKSHNKSLGEQKVILSKVQLELANLITKHSTQKKDLEATRSSEAEQKSRLEAKSKELDDAMARHGEEVETLRHTNEEEHLLAVNESEDRYLKMVEDNSTKEKEWVQSMDALRAEMQTQKDEFARQLESHEAYKKGIEEQSAKQAELATSMASWRSKHSELQKENENMERILQGLGHATEVKSKGDEFFIAAFQHIAESIANLCAKNFRHLPEELPREIMLLIPAEIPDFMSSSESAYELRCLYCQHKIWDVLNIRIFEPFLFTLGRHYGGVDNFLSTLSRDIRHKSERREAAWRQTTLRAAFTVSHAKQAINLVATLIVEEILTEVKYFAMPDSWTALRAGLQRIVKSAAEVWRFARVEREMVLASMPDAREQDENGWLEALQVNGAGQKSWPTIKPPNTMILRVRAHIVRQRVHTDLLPTEDRDNSLPCTYLQGQALFTDSSVVLGCRRESLSGTLATELPPTTNNTLAPGQYGNSQPEQ